MTTIYEDYLKSLDQKEWNLIEDVPGWEVGNVPATIETAPDPSKRISMRSFCIEADSR